LSMRMLAALAFVPPHRVEEYFKELSDPTRNLVPPEAIALLDYIEDTYIGRPLRGRQGRRQPTFPIPVWNVYDRVLAGKARTNNAVEAWHRGVQQAFQCHYPTIWKFIKKLGTEQKKRDTVIENMVAGQRPPPRRKEYVNLDTRILIIVRDFGNRSIADYLRGIAHNLSY
ncbi:MAG: hypothetical protein GY696_33165, partial [Gammaproteobacteria bacterium]|nr:hypothetical protein [Gammaproteobacteria bacterium]